MHHLLSFIFGGIAITFVAGLVLFFVLILAKRVFYGGSIHDQENASLLDVESQTLVVSIHGGANAWLREREHSRTSAVFIHGRANARLRELEERLNVLYDSIQNKKRSLLTRSLLVGLTIATGGLSKVVQVPYDICSSKGKRKLKADFKYTQLEAAEIYYVQGGKYGYDDLHKLPADQPRNLLLTESKWKSGRNKFINKLKKFASDRHHEATNILKMDDLTSNFLEKGLEFSYQSIKDRITYLGYDFSGFAVAEMGFDDIMSSAIDLLL